MSLFPNIEEIRYQYNEIIPLLQNLKTKQDVIEFGEKYGITMEINHFDAEAFYEKRPIRVIRCEAWKDLDYIYVYTDGSAPTIDIWCDVKDYIFLDSSTIETLEENYIKGVKRIWSKNDRDVKFEIIRTLRTHNINYNDMIDIYGLDADIVEAYEDDHYEQGYNDNN